MSEIGIEPKEKEEKTLDEELDEAIARGLNNKNNDIGLLISFHLRDAIGKDPIEKIRLICEAYYIVADSLETDQELRAQVHRIHALALMFREVSIMDPVISMPWPFTHTLENFNAWIRPWMAETPLSLITFRYTNPNMEALKRRELSGVGPDGQVDLNDFWKITTRLDLSPVSLKALKILFGSWALSVLMPLYSKIATTFNIASPKVWTNRKEKAPG